MYRRFTSLQVPGARRFSFGAASAVLFLSLLAGMVPANRPEAAPRRTSDFTWTGFAGTEGGSLPAEDRAEAVTFDTQGNVLAAGYIRRWVDRQSSDVFTIGKWHPTGARAWVRQFEESPFSVNQAQCVATAADGSAVAGGFGTDSTGNEHFTVAMWDTHGDLVWLRKLDRSPMFDERVRAVAVDPQGNVIAAGTSFSDATAWDVTVVKFRGSDGEPLWVHHIDGTERSFDKPRAMVLDRQGNAYIGGELGTWDGSSCAVMKVRGDDGEVLWINSIDLPEGLGGGEQVNALSIISDEDVVAVGTAVGGLSFYDFVVGRFDGDDGTLEWSHRHDSGVGQRMDEGVAVAVDRHDNVLALGNVESLDGNNLLLLKLGGDGVLQWQSRLSNPLARRHFAFSRGVALVVDDRDDAHVAAQLSSHEGETAALVTWDHSGTQRTVRYLSQPQSGQFEVPETLAVDRRGNLAFAGAWTSMPGAGNFVVAYSASRRVERLQVSPSYLHFRATRLGHSAMRPLVIRNAGTAELTGEISASSPEFQLLDAEGEEVTTREFQLAPGVRLVLNVRFTPEAAGVRRGSLVISSSDPRRPTGRVVLTGLGRK